MINSIGRSTLIAFLLVSHLITAPAQAPVKSLTADQSPTVNDKPRPAADETFDLNIDHRRIVKENFRASTAVGIQPDRHSLELQIGVGLTASRIEVVLLNVRGSVRFRGNLDRILEILNLRPAVSSP